MSTPSQKAVATIIDEADRPYNGFSDYYEYVKHEYERKRDFLVSVLSAAHLKPVVPEGGFFVIADTSAHSFPETYFDQPGPAGEVPVTRDWAFARYGIIIIFFGW